MIASITMVSPTDSPPAVDALVALADRCVQCGLCLPHCPTYRLDRRESESPRGRIALAKALANEAVPADPSTDLPLDHCLACRRCEPVCPAGVQYGELIVETRYRQRQRRRPVWRLRVVEWLAARPRILTRLLGLYRLAAPVLPRGGRPLPPPHPQPPPTLAKSGPVAVFLGCVARGYERPVQAALQRLLAALDIALAAPPEQSCCGALHAHAGDAETASRLAAINRTAFARTRTVLTLASGCHEAVAESLPDGTEGIDALDYLHRHGGRLHFRRAGERVALHVPCTQHSVVGSDKALRALLARIPGLDIVELNGFGCCGAAGLHMLAEPERSARLRQPLLDTAHASAATTLLSANIGCRLHLAGHTNLRVIHPLEFLAEHLS